MNKLAISTILLLLLSTGPMTEFPVESSAVNWIQPHGNVDHGGGNAFFHDGIDFGTDEYGNFYATTDGTVFEVDLDTQKGYPGNNYRIMIDIGDGVLLDYHFEIGGNATPAKRQANVLVTQGQAVSAGQHIANLIHGDDSNAADVAHVHWGIYGNVEQGKCPLSYFTSSVALQLETLYDSGIEKRPANRENLCN